MLFVLVTEEEGSRVPTAGDPPIQSRSPTETCHAYETLSMKAL